MCGIPRSGSTLIWQILQALFPNDFVVKTHPDIWMNDGSFLIASIRSPHDVVASLLRVRLSREGRNKICSEDVDAVIKRMIISFDRLKELLKGPHILFRYEQFYNNHSIIYNVIENIYSIKINNNMRERINDQFNWKSNKKRADKLNNFNEIGEAQIHGDHIGHVHPGYWCEYLPDWCLDNVRKICNEIGRQWGYED